MHAYHSPGIPHIYSLPANHPCTLPCHAPTSCPEDEPCRATINISCPCGRIRQPVSCGRSTANPAGREGSQPLKCTNECAIAKRNARLAEALGINTSSADSKAAAVSYSDELIGFARTNMKFCLLVEKTLSEWVFNPFVNHTRTDLTSLRRFVSSDRRSQVLPHMPEQRRNFVHNVRTFFSLAYFDSDRMPSWLLYIVWTPKWSIKNLIAAFSSSDGSTRVYHLHYFQVQQLPVLV